MVNRGSCVVTCLAVLLVLIVLLPAGSALAAERLLIGPQRAVPGGPKLAMMPDLVTKSIEFVQPTKGSCTGPLQASIVIKVKFQNLGTAAAVLPAWQPWLKVWSILGGTSPPYVAEFGSPPGPLKLDPGEIGVFETKLSVFAKASPDKTTSNVGIGVIVDPNKAIAELNENNNYQEKQITFLGVCP